MKDQWRSVFKPKGEEPQFVKVVIAQKPTNNCTVDTIVVLVKEKHCLNKIKQNRLYEIVLYNVVFKNS